MKKVFLIVFTLIVITNCKKPIEVSSRPADYCDELSKIDTNDTEAIKVWIMEHEVDLCNGNLYKCIMDRHKIGIIKFESMITNPLPYKIKWSILRDNYIMDKCYSDYLSFIIDQNKNEITGLKMINGFTKNPSCYSPVLFRAINIENGNLKDNDIFEFFMAKDSKNNQLVIFKINGKGTGYDYYDLTLDPTFLPIIKYFNNINPTIAGGK